MTIFFGGDSVLSAAGALTGGIRSYTGTAGEGTGGTCQKRRPRPLKRRTSPRPFNSSRTATIREVLGRR